MSQLTVLALGALGSAATILGPSRMANWLTGFGVVVLVLTLPLAVVTYSATTPTVGVGRNYISDARRKGYDESEWLDSLLDGYETWVSSMSSRTETTAMLLLLSRLSFSLGAVLVGVGIVVGLFTG